MFAPFVFKKRMIQIRISSLFSRSRPRLRAPKPSPAEKGDRLRVAIHFVDEESLICTAECLGV